MEFVEDGFKFKTILLAAHHFKGTVVVRQFLFVDYAAA